jgi:hypothetical protein
LTTLLTTQLTQVRHFYDPRPIVTSSTRFDHCPGLSRRYVCPALVLSSSVSVSLNLQEEFDGPGFCFSSVLFTSIPRPSWVSQNQPGGSKTMSWRQLWFSFTQDGAFPGSERRPRQSSRDWTGLAWNRVDIWRGWLVGSRLVSPSGRHLSSRGRHPKSGGFYHSCASCLALLHAA